MPLASDPGSWPPAFSEDLLRALGNSVTGGSLAGACQTIFGRLDLLISSSTPDIENCTRLQAERGTWHDRCTCNCMTTAHLKCLLGLRQSPSQQVPCATRCIEKDYSTIASQSLLHLKINQIGYPPASGTVPNGIWQAEP